MISENNYFANQLSPLHQSAQYFLSCAAIKTNGITLSYFQVSQLVLSIGAQLTQYGLREGSRLGVVSANNLEMILLYWACIDLGILYCPISYRFPAQQIDSLFKSYRISHYWSSTPQVGIHSSCPLKINFKEPDSKFDALFNGVDIYYKPANIIFTSGSSGTPKAAVHSLKNHIASAKGSAKVIPLNIGDNWLLSLPLFHIGGLAILNRCVLAGACVVIKNDNCDLASQLMEDKISHVSMVATQLLRLLNENAESLNGLKALLLGGGAISNDLIMKLKGLNIPAFTSYGMTEMSSQITTGYATGDGSSGKLLVGRQLKIRDDIIWVKGNVLFCGYLQADGTWFLEKDGEGWFCTKDCGYWNEHGNLQITGRSDNMFVCGGENLQPEEVENALRLHSDIEETIVFPIKDNEFGLLPAAIIKIKNGELPNIESIENLFLKHIARFKRPRRYYLWPSNIEQAGLKINRKQIIDIVVGTACFQEC